MSTVLDVRELSEDAYLSARARMIAEGNAARLRGDDERALAAVGRRHPDLWSRKHE